MRKSVFALAALLLLCACSSTETAASQYQVTGVLEGLLGSYVVIEDRGRQQQTLSTNGSFTFNIRAGQAYDLIVNEQPRNPDQLCTVENGSGVANQPRNGVRIVCRELAYRIGGRVSQLEGSGLRLKNGEDEVQISDDGIFQMQKLVAADTAYDIRVSRQPEEPNQICTVQNGAGVVTEFDVNNITVTCTTSLVVPLYPSHGRNWNDWVKNDGPSPLYASDTICSGEEVGRSNACLHGGAMRTFLVPGETKCDGLRAQDDRDAFEWVCEASTTPSTRFVSVGLKRGFSELVNFSLGALHKPVVTVYKDDDIYMRTEPSIWWQNPLINAGDGGTLTVPTGGILIADVTPENGYVLTTSRITFLVPPGRTLLGPSATPGPILQATDVRFLWVEGDFDARNNSNALNVATGKVVNLRNVGVMNASGAGLNLQGVNLLQAKGLRLANNERGLRLSNVVDATVEQVTASNNQVMGVQLDGAQHVALSRIVSTFNNGAGIEITNADHDFVLSHLTLSNNGGAGLSVDGPISNIDYSGNHHRVEGLLALNNTHAVSLTGSVGMRFHQLAATHHSSAALTGSGLSNIAFTGSLLLGQQTTSCAMSGTNVGLDTNCATPAPSTGVSSDLSASLANSLIGPVNSDDPTQPDDVSGLVARNDGTKWLQLSSWLRLLGRDFALTSPSAKQRCLDPNCRVQDYSLAASDTVARARAARPSANQRLVHVWSATTKGGCDKLVGATFANNTCSSGFLAHAIERAGDGFGNDDGLCEASEHCDEAVHIGADTGLPPNTTEPLGAGQVANVTLHVFDPSIPAR